MKTNTSISINWHKFISELNWGRSNSAASARLALSWAIQHEMPKDLAIGSILKLPAATYVRENRHLLFAAWTEISMQLNGEPMFFELEPIFDTAA